mmetsp:Transcript_13837/g.56082  ORF Transcript_13837/g.56082 Transcript_13837/m.56082 type:complete len:242 (-) Transcript_13837:71-796(-)
MPAATSDAARTATPRSTLRSAHPCGCTMLTLASAVAGRMTVAVGLPSMASPFNSASASSIAADVSARRALSASDAPLAPSFFREVISARWSWRLFGRNITPKNARAAATNASSRSPVGGASSLTSSSAMGTSSAPSRSQARASAASAPTRSRTPSSSASAEPSAVNPRSRAQNVASAARNSSDDASSSDASSVPFAAAADGILAMNAGVKTTPPSEYFFCFRCFPILDAIAPEGVRPRADA